MEVVQVEIWIAYKEMRGDSTQLHTVGQWSENVLLWKIYLFSFIIINLSVAALSDTNN